MEKLFLGPNVPIQLIENSKNVPNKLKDINYITNSEYDLI